MAATMAPRCRTSHAWRNVSGSGRMACTAAQLPFSSERPTRCRPINSEPTTRLISPATVKAPCVTTCASITNSAAPRISSARPAQLIGSTAKPNRASSRATAPSAPGRTTPGWKISKPIPARPARNRSGIRLGSISAFSSRVKKPGCTCTSSAPAVCSVSFLPTVVRPSILLSRSGRVGARTSTTFICFAWTLSRLLALRTAWAAQAALRPW